MNTFEEIKTWFELAMPKPTKDNQRVQVGVHVEEFAEMCVTLEVPDQPNYGLLVGNATYVTNHFADTLKKSKDLNLVIKDRKELLDSLCDQIVTVIGCAHVYGLDILGALQEVSRSNNSKFVDGLPVFNENGKIAKGPYYSKPVLDTFLGTDPAI